MGKGEQSVFRTATVNYIYTNSKYFGILTTGAEPYNCVLASIRPAHLICDKSK